MSKPDTQPNRTIAEVTNDTRARVITAVWRVIAEQGMAAVSMRTVAASADVSVGRIQYWFGSKDELLEASLVAMLAGAEDQHRQSIGQAPRVAANRAGDLDRLRHLIGHPIPRAGEAPEGVAVFHHYVTAAINHPRLAELLIEAKQGQEREAVRLLRRLAPGLPGPRGAARALLATADGLSLRVLIGSITPRAAQRLLWAEIDRTVG